MCLMVSGCAAPQVDGLLITPSMAEGLCWWQGVKWDDRGPLRVTRDGLAFGRARIGWNKTDWRGSTVTGVLRERQSKVVLDGVWTGDGMTLRAEADATTDAVFTMWDPTKLSRASLVLRGAPVRLLDARVGAALVAPSEQSMGSFVPDEVPVREVQCDSLALRASITGGPDARQLLTRAGFPPDAPEVLVKAEEGSALVATDTPDGRFIGGFRPGSATGRFFELSRAGGRVRVAAIDDGTLWVGWVDASGVSAVKEPVELGKPARAARRELPMPTWRACKEEVQLAVRSSVGAMRFVGTLHAGTRFAVTGMSDGEGDRVGVWPGVDWFEPTRELLAPAEAAACPQVVGPW